MVASPFSSFYYSGNTKKSPIFFRIRLFQCPYIYWAAAIFIVVSNYSNLFLPFAFFLDCSHFTLGYELIVRPETAGFVKSIRNLFPLV